MFKLIIEIMRTFPFVVIEAWYSAWRYNTVLISVIKGTFTLVTFAPWGVHRQQWRSVAFPSSIFSNLDFTRVPRVSMCLPPPFLSAFCFFSSTEPSFRTDRKTPLSLISQVPSTMTRYISLPSSTSFVPLWIGLTSSLSESSRSIGDRDRVRDPPCKLNNRMIWFFCRLDCASASSFYLIGIVWLVECHYWLRFIERPSRVAFFRVEKVRILLFVSWVVKDRNELRRTEIFVNREGFVRRWFPEKSTENDG